MRRNAFGQLITKPTLRLFAPDDPDLSGGGGDPKPLSLTEDGETYEFPPDTRVADMTEAQKTEYWRHKARKHEKASKDRADYDAIKQELDDLKAAGLTQEQKDRQAAIDEARLQGENIGAEKHLRTAVQSKFQFLTGKSDDDVAKAFERVDPKAFLDDKGEIDQAALKDFAELFGTNAGGNGNSTTDPVRDAIERQRLGGGTGSAGSIKEMQKQRYEQLRPSN
jgi:hypothetical protein